MSLTIPGAYSSITVHQFTEYKNANDDIDRVMAITGADYETVRQLEAKSLPGIIEAFELLLTLEQQSFKPLIEIEGRTFGLIPNFDRISIGEHIDIESYCENFFKYACHILSIIYRPVTDKIGEHYLIEPYTGARSEFFREHLSKTITLDQFNGAMLFFSTIARELSENSDLHLMTELQKAVREMRIAILEETPN